MFGTRRDEAGSRTDELDLRDSPGDEPVWTGAQIEVAHQVDPAPDEPPVADAAALDLADSPGDEPVHVGGTGALAVATPGATDGDGEPGPEDVPADGDPAGDDPRGRRADRPTEVPPRGWLDVAKRVKDEARKDNLTLVSAGIAFYALLSLFPALAAMVSIYGLVSDPADVTGQIDDLSSTMPAEARQILQDQLTAVTSSGRASLGLGVVLGIAVALWGASSAMSQLLVALSLVYDEDETRGPVKLRGLALALTFGGLVFLAAVVGLIAVIPAWLASSPVGGGAETAVGILRWPVLLVLMLAALAFLYRVGADRDRPKMRWVSPGAVVATALWLLASAAFSFYASHFATYNKTYGAMGAVIVLMMWLLITALCVLVGAEVNAELEHQTERDTTRGRREPMGERGAYVADTVAGTP